MIYLPEKENKIEEEETMDVSEEDWKKGFEEAEGLF